MASRRPWGRNPLAPPICCGPTGVGNHRSERNGDTCQKWCDLRERATGNFMDPLIKRVLGLQEHEMEGGKLHPETVLYLTPEQIGDESGAHCGACYFFNPSTSNCRITKPSKCNGERGVCGFFVGSDDHQTNEPLQLVSKKSAGYIEEGPTHCASCEYFNGENACKKVGGHIEPNGCCNHWEAGDED
jgi:hypothetical protein